MLSRERVQLILSSPQKKKTKETLYLDDCTGWQSLQNNKAPLSVLYKASTWLNLRVNIFMSMKSFPHADKYKYICVSFTYKLIGYGISSTHSELTPLPFLEGKLLRLSATLRQLERDKLNSRQEIRHPLTSRETYIGAGNQSTRTNFK